MDERAQLLERPAIFRREIQEMFDKLAYRHRLSRHVGWGLSDQMEENYWVFHSFGNYSGVRGRGAECLQEVCHLADDYSVAMHLWTASPELHPYYERFGFAKSEPPRERAEGIQWFRREPLTERW